MGIIEFSAPARKGIWHLRADSAEAQTDGILVIRILHAARDIDAEFPHD
jgi:plasmid stabilization system protein ParE